MSRGGTTMNENVRSDDFSRRLAGVSMAVADTRCWLAANG